MSELIITRTKSFTAKKIPFKVIVDDTEIGVIRDGETKNFEISSGAHQLQIGYGKKVEKFGTKIIEATDQAPVEIKTEISRSILIGTMVLGGGGALVGVGLSRGGLSILGLIITAIGAVIYIKATKDMGGKVCKLL